MATRTRGAAATTTPLERELEQARNGNHPRQVAEGKRLEQMKISRLQQADQLRKYRLSHRGEAQSSVQITSSRTHGRATCGSLTPVAMGPTVTPLRGAYNVFNTLPPSKTSWRAARRGGAGGACMIFAPILLANDIRTNSTEPRPSQLPTRKLTRPRATRGVARRRLSRCL